MYIAHHRETSNKKQCKNYPKIHGQTKGWGGGLTIAPPLNTPLMLVEY